MLLIGISGIPYIVQYATPIIISLLVITIIVLLFRRTHIDISFIIFISIFIFLTYIQLTTFNVFPVNTVLGFISKIFVAYAITKVLNRSFITTYINCIIAIAIISFAFWIPALVSSGLKSVIIKSAPFDVENTFNSYIIFQPNFGESGTFARNSGPFWEPGAFAGFLMIALLLNFIEFPKISNRRNLVLLLSILSTFSTTAYISLFLFVFFIIIKHRNIVTSALVLIVFIPISIIAYQNLPFLQEKLADQLEMSESKMAYTNHRTRFTSAAIDLKDFQEYPLAGRGKYDETRFSMGAKAINRNNGLTDLLVMYGLIGFVLYFTYYFVSFRNIMKYYNKYLQATPYYYLLIILVLGFSENYFLLPFFWSLCFIGYSFANRKASHNLNSNLLFQHSSNN